MGNEMSKQIITSESGERLVVLPEAEYEALLDAAEDAADRAAFDDYERRRAAGDVDLVPDHVVARLTDPKENPVRVWREFRGLTGAELARQAGLSAPYITQIETGQRDPGLKALKAIASVLKVDLDDLV